MEVKATKLHNGIRIAVPATLLLGATNVMAATDYSALTTSVDWTAVGTALLAVGGAVIAIAVTFKGIKLVIKMVRGG